MSSEILKDRPSHFVWYELHTPDAASAEAFYRSVLGWGAHDAGMPDRRYTARSISLTSRRMGAHDAGMPDRRYTLVTVDKIPIGGLLEKPASSFTAGTAPGWMGYIGVDDVDAYSKRVQQAGGVVHRAVEDIPGVGRFAVVADPQGAIFMLFQSHDGRQQPERPRAGAPGSAAWHDLAAIDWQSDFAFYADMFGWSKADTIGMGLNGVYQIFAAGSEPIGGMMTRMDPAQSPGWLFYFNVNEIEVAIGRVKQHGGRVVHGPSVVPGGQQIAHCLDPQGAIFGIVGPKN